MIIPDPRFMPLQDWADRVFDQLSVSGCPMLMPGDDWQAWARVLIGTVRIGRRGDLPAPEAFSDWREWAERLVLALSAEGT